VVELAALQADWKLRFGDICKPLEVGISEAAQEAAWGRMTDPLLTGGSGPPVPWEDLSSEDQVSFVTSSINLELIRARYS